MKKIKIIDLLNKISKNEKVPDTITWEGEKYLYSKIHGDYIKEKNNLNEANIYLFKNLISNIKTQFFINYTVDIIEDNDYTFKENEIIDQKTLIKKCYNMSLKISEINEKLDELIERVKNGLD